MKKTIDKLIKESIRKILLEADCGNLEELQKKGWKSTDISTYDLKKADSNWETFECTVNNTTKYFIRKKGSTGGTGTGGTGTGGTGTDTDKVYDFADGIFKIIENVALKVVDGVTTILGKTVEEVSDLGGKSIDVVADDLEKVGNVVYKVGGKLYKVVTSGTGNQSKPVTTLPEWTKQFPCLLGGVALGQGDVATIFDKKNNVPVELYKDFKAKDTSGYMGTWSCDGDKLTVEMTSTKYTQNKDGGGDKGSSGKKCDQSAFPDCVQGFKWDANSCTYRSSAYDDAKTKYTVAYYNTPAKTSTGVDGNYCVVFKGNTEPSPGQYLCSETLPQIYSKFGVLEAVDEGIRRAIPSVDQAKLLADMKSIPDFLQYNAAGTNLTGIKLPVLEQIVQDIQDLIFKGYQGLDIGYLISFLQQVERFANGEGLTEQSKIVSGALDRINNAITNFKSKDPKYNPVTNPSPQDLKNYREEVIKVEYLKDLKVYKKKLQGREALGANVAQSTEYQQGQGYRPEDCKKYLETYLVSKNLGYLVGVNTTPAGGDDLSEQDLIEVIKACRTNQTYKKGFLGKNSKYAKAVDFIGQESPARGGINFNEP